MAEIRDQPYTGSRFLVAIGDDDGRAPAAGFAEVVFPLFERRHESPTASGADGRPANGDDGPTLVLRRGVTGERNLYRWWDDARRDNAAPTRTVTVQLLADDERTVVMTWRFLRAYPVTLGYSPLNAMSGGVVMEQVTLAFERVEME